MRVYRFVPRDYTTSGRLKYTKTFPCFISARVFGLFDALSEALRQGAAAAFQQLSLDGDPLMLRGLAE